MNPSLWPSESVLISSPHSSYSSFSFSPPSGSDLGSIRAITLASPPTNKMRVQFQRLLIRDIYIYRHNRGLDLVEKHHFVPLNCAIDIYDAWSCLPTRARTRIHNMTNWLPLSASTLIYFPGWSHFIWSLILLALEPKALLLLGNYWNWSNRIATSAIRVCWERWNSFGAEIYLSIASLDQLSSYLPWIANSSLTRL